MTGKMEMYSIMLSGPLGKFHCKGYNC